VDQNLENQPLSFQHMHEGTRPNQPLAGMLPAQERFGPMMTAASASICG